VLTTNLSNFISIQKDEEVEDYRRRFAGSQADRLERDEAEKAAKLAEQLKKKASGCILLAALCSPD
jgi:hypothetical protein